LKHRIINNYSDLFGISTSIICAIHCAVLPFFISSMPFWVSVITKNSWVELVLIGSSFVIGAFAFYKGCFIQHKRKLPLSLFSTGFAFLLLHQVTAWFTLILIPAATLLMISAHLMNFVYCRKHKNCSLH